MLLFLSLFPPICLSLGLGISFITYFSIRPLGKNEKKDPTFIHILFSLLSYEVRVRFRIRVQVQVCDSAIFEKVGYGCGD